MKEMLANSPHPSVHAALLLPEQAPASVLQLPSPLKLCTYLTGCEESQFLINQQLIIWFVDYRSTDTWAHTHQLAQRRAQVRQCMTYLPEGGLVVSSWASSASPHAGEQPQAAKLGHPFALQALVPVPTCPSVGLCSWCVISAAHAPDLPSTTAAPCLQTDGNLKLCRTAT